MIGAGQALSEGIGPIQRQRDVEPALGIGIVVATRVGNGGSELQRTHTAIDGRRVAIERVQVNGTFQQIAASVVTVGYMSPEQVRGLLADARSDIFAFGACGT